jgi:citrate synthase
MLTVVAQQDSLQPNSAARALQQAWTPDRPQLAPLLDMALCLCADHELNVSAFTVRTVASARSTPYAAINAGLSALQGSLHGGHTERVLAMLREVGEPRFAAQTIASRLRRGDVISGFHHKLYPEGDPRAKVLLAAIRQAFPDAPTMALIDAVQTAVFNTIGHYATVDLALVALAQVAQLPEDAPLTIFAIGRTAGWLAHAIEQYGQGQLIRPRAKYIGN